MSRWVWISFLLVLVLGTVFYYGSSTGFPVDVAFAQLGEIRTYVEERAKTRLPRIYRITMPLDGRIQPIRLREDDKISVGDTVAEMDPADLDTDLAEATSRVGQFEQLLLSLVQTIKAAEAQRDARRPKVAFADSEYKRISSLAEKNAATESQLSEAELLKLESAFDLKKEEFTVQSIVAIKAAVDLGREDAEEQRKRRQRDRNRASLTSPVEGVVLRRHVSNERVLSAGEVLLEIGRLEDLEVEAEILTQDVVEIEIGDPVDIEGPAIGAEPIAGQVVRIYPQGFKKVSSLGVEQQRVLVIIRFEAAGLEKLRQAGRRLGADYRVRVKIYTAQKSDALKIPRSALFRSANGGWQAFVVRDGFAERVDVKVGLSNDFEVEVLSGIQAGEQVILAPESSLAAGQRVEPFLNDQKH